MSLIENACAAIDESKWRDMFSLIKAYLTWLTGY